MEFLDTQAVITDAKNAVMSVKTTADFELIKSKYFGPNGLFKSLMQNLGKIDKEKRPEAGKVINDCKQSVLAIFDEVAKKVEQNEIEKILGAKIDQSMSLDANIGKKHILTQLREDITNILGKIGFTAAEGPEIDTEWFCFDSLNTPESHPARDSHDTFFFPENFNIENTNKHSDEKYLLRSHTSTVQIRTMLKEQPPLKIMSSGRTFRRDTADATHSANFHQCEGLHVDKNLSVADLKSTINFLLKELFGGECKIRFRPSFFPFTEASFEVDMSVPNLGKLSNKWVEILGCGMVDPEVFKSVNYDSNVLRGYAFGIGLERVAMLRHGIDDIRLFYQNDTRFLKQF